MSLIKSSKTFGHYHGQTHTSHGIEHFSLSLERISLNQPTNKCQLTEERAKAKAKRKVKATEDFMSRKEKQTKAKLQPAIPQLKRMDE